jgi:hypothetical protein
MLDSTSKRRVPRRDFVVLPLLSIITVLLMFGVAELACRIFWPAREYDTCAVGDDVTGFRMRPNCTSTMKNAEGVWTTNRYNECGYRSETSCGPKPPGAFRIVLLGSSVAQGTFIPYGQTFFARAAKQISAQCHTVVDVQSLGVPNSSPIFVYRRLNEALALKPDVVLFVLTPFDLEQKINPAQLAERNDPHPRFSEPAVQLRIGPFKRLERTLLQSRAVLIAQHYLFSDENTFLRLYLVYGDKADFLRSPLSPAWQKRYEDLSVIIGDMAERVRAAGASLCVMPVPSRAEAALLSAPRRPGIDAEAFGRTLEKIASQHGAKSIDLMNTFEKIPKSENLFYVVDGHLTPEGQKAVSQQVARALMKGGISGSCGTLRAAGF